MARLVLRVKRDRKEFAQGRAEHSIDKEDFVRGIVVIALALSGSACSFLDQLDFGSSGLDPNKIYLGQTDVVAVSQRETYRYACVSGPMLCVQHGIKFECRCP